MVTNKLRTEEDQVQQKFESASERYQPSSTRPPPASRSPLPPATDPRVELGRSDVVVDGIRVPRHSSTAPASLPIAE